MTVKQAILHSGLKAGLARKLYLIVVAESHKSIRIEHEFTGSETIYLDLYEGVEINEDSYWLKKTADVSGQVESAVSPEAFPSGRVCTDRLRLRE